MAPSSPSPAAVLQLCVLLLLCSSALHAASAQFPLVSSGLEAILARYESGDLQQEGATTAASSSNSIASILAKSKVTGSVIVGDSVRISAAAAVGSTAEDLTNELTSIGANQLASSGHVVSGLLPITSIAKLGDLNHMQLISQSMHGVSQISRQASRALSASLKLQGSWKRPVKVGVLSDSFNRFKRYQYDIKANALPTGVVVYADDNTGYDEGRGMLQLVHDVAPDASLAFHTATLSEARFALGIEQLADEGCQVIVDDVLYYAEPMFQNGIVAQAVNRVRARGVAYFSAAGNQAFNSYSAAFVDSGVAGVTRNSRRHLFGVSNGENVTSQLFRFAPGVTTIILNWDQPSYSVSGGSGCRSDVNMYASVENATNLYVYYPADTNNLGGDAFEVLQVINFGFRAKVVPITIEWVRGVKPNFLKYVIFSDYHSYPVTFATNSSTAYGHTTAAGSVAVGAANYLKTRAYTGTTTKRESFSSAVGTPLLIDDFGKRLPTPQVNQNLIVAPDGLDTTVYLGPDDNRDGQAEFFGTSAAAPNAAAVAALLLGTSPTELTAGDVINAMFETAEDMDDPRTPGFDVGWDSATGYGMINATSAANKFNIFACTA